METLRQCFELAQKVMARQKEAINALQERIALLQFTIDTQKETIAIYEKRAVRQAVQNAEKEARHVEKDCGHFKLDDTDCPACEYASRH